MQTPRMFRRQGRFGNIFTYTETTAVPTCIAFAFPVCISDAGHKTRIVSDKIELLYLLELQGGSGTGARCHTSDEFCHHTTSSATHHDI